MLGPASTPQVPASAPVGAIAGAQNPLVGTHACVSLPPALDVERQLSLARHWAPLAQSFAQNVSPPIRAHAELGRQSADAAQGSQLSAAAPASERPPRSTSFPQAIAATKIAETCTARKYFNGRFR